MNKTKVILDNEDLTSKIHELQLLVREMGAKLNELEFHRYGISR